jgi:nucleotide-binding universal stress UspA family protein
MRQRPEIVVGINHSLAAQAALRWAVDEASRLRANVTVVHAVDAEQRADLAMARDVEAERRESSGRAQQWAAESVPMMPPDVHATFVTPLASITQALTSAARGALLVVVGQPQDDRLSDLPQRLAQGLECPVFCVDGTGTADLVVARDVNS